LGGKPVSHRKLPKETTFVTSGISRLWGSLLSGDHYFRRVVTFGEQKTFYKVGRNERFLRNKRREFVKTVLKTRDTILRLSLNL